MAKHTLTLDRAVQFYLGHLQQLGKHPRTLYTYGMDLQVICAFFKAETEINRISLLQVGKFYRSAILLKRTNGCERAERTVTKTVRVFRMFLVWAYQAGYLETLPLPKSTPMGRSLR